jgi:hypothetical protein
MKKAANTTRTQYINPEGIELIKSFDRFILFGISLVGIVVLAAAFFFFRNIPLIALVIAVTFSIVIINKTIRISRMTKISGLSDGACIKKENNKQIKYAEQETGSQNF